MFDIKEEMYTIMTATGAFSRFMCWRGCNPVLNQANNGTILISYQIEWPSKLVRLNHTMSSKYTIKQILTTNQNWWKFYEKYKDNLRPSIVTTITKLLSCKNKIRGYHE